jgi:uncharacterized protein (DUF2267 family)
MIGPEEKQTVESLSNLYTPQTPEEALLVRAVLEILRDPDPGSQVQAGLPQMIRQIQATGKSFISASES